MRCICRITWYLKHGGICSSYTVYRQAKFMDHRRLCLCVINTALRFLLGMKTDLSPVMSCDNKKAGMIGRKSMEPSH